jgi:hypothetical protein
MLLTYFLESIKVVHGGACSVIRHEPGHTRVVLMVASLARCLAF